MSESPRRGIRLIDVLIVIGIAALSIGLLLPAVRTIREPANRMKCSNNLKQIMLGMHNYADTNSCFPTGCIGPGTTPEERLSWMFALLPYVEQDALAHQFDMKKGYAENLPTAQAIVKTYLCPNGNRGAVEPITYYMAMAGIGLDAATRAEDTAGNGFMGYDRQTSMASIKDGDWHTIALMETRFDLGPWVRGGMSNLRGFDPDDLPWYGKERPFDGHPKGINVALADGSTRFLSSSIDAKVLAAAITIAGGEPFDL
ncbi:MAG TPA: DUF1559 domain-containing protein [Gemmataceae bacterium]|jgi:Tfp pilus assembly protein PilE|nr:DUF1559 domain-containing protein [Gemmataceae bacterium]